MMQTTYIHTYIHIVRTSSFKSIHKYIQTAQREYFCANVDIYGTVYVYTYIGFLLAGQDEWFA